MKAAINGTLNISVLEGWWEEACELHPGWVIGRGEVYEDADYQDEVESNALYDLLETEVIPLFYSRSQDGVPHGWIERIKESLATLVPQYNTNGMVREYLEDLYLPNQRRWEQLNGDRERIARLSEWKAGIRSAWSEVRIEEVEADSPQRPKVGARIPVSASVRLGSLAPHFASDPWHRMTFASSCLPAASTPGKKSCRGHPRRCSTRTPMGTTGTPSPEATAARPRDPTATPCGSCPTTPICKTPWRWGWCAGHRDNLILRG